MRVLILANNGAGLYKFRRELIETLKDLNYEIYVSIPDDRFDAELENVGCIIRKCQISRHGVNPFQDLKLLRDYKSQIKSVKPDIVFTYTIKPNVYGGMACAGLNVPFIANITGLGTAVEHGGILQKLTVLLYRYGLRKVQTVFFQNKENEIFFSKKKIALNKHKLLPGSGVNLTHYCLTPYPASENIEFAFVGRLMKEKGIDLYIEAAKYIKNIYPNTIFHVCGSSEEAYEDEVANLHQQGIINYHGPVRDMRDIYERVHCIVHPSYYPEGMSNVLLEASACGRPIITTDRSGCREVVDDGVNGYMIPQKDAKALIAAIEKFLTLSNEEKRQMGLAGRAKVEKEFDRQIVVEAYLSEIEKLS